MLHFSNLPTIYDHESGIIFQKFCFQECKYWPIYPCYSEKKPMVNCIHEYTNDPISVDQDNPNEHSTAQYMYEKMKATIQGCLDFLLKPIVMEEDISILRIMNIGE